MAPKIRESRDAKPDRISDLPGGVLCHILSFLTTEESVRTRVLSRQWKHVFASVPVLDFRYPDEYRDESVRKRFIDFVNSIWVSYNASRMRKFSFYLRGVQPPNQCLIDSWIRAAIRREVEEIDFSILEDEGEDAETMALPHRLFSCKTLSVLRVKGDFNISLPDSECLTCLKTCSLIGVYFSVDSAKRFFQNLKVLETLELDLSRAKEEGVESFFINAPNLKRLTISYCDFFRGIVLNVPNLNYLKYTGWAKNDIIGLESLKSVVDASIIIDTSNSIPRDDVVVKLLCAICHVRELTLSCTVIEAFVRSDESLPKFNKLTRLMLGPISSLASKLLQDLLTKSTTLEFFSFNQWSEGENNGPHENSYSLPEDVPTCVSLHLKEVKCPVFTGLDYDLKLLKYFQKNAKNLKDIKINSNSTLNEEGEIVPAPPIVFNSDGDNDTSS